MAGERGTEPMRHTPGAYAVGPYLLLHRDAVGRYDTDQRNTDRQIPRVVLTPDAEDRAT